MFDADIAFSSAGRTIYELALMCTPSIVMAQNERELSHFFASAEHGFVHLGMGKDASEQDILNAFEGLVTSHGKRNSMSMLMRRHDIKNGSKRVVKLIKDLIQN
jgi:spore coat polysaccharide biosynthesis predicted glycosyltransferase SpsG